MHILILMLRKMSGFVFCTTGCQYWVRRSYHRQRNTQSPNTGVYCWGIQDWRSSSTEGNYIAESQEIFLKDLLLNITGVQSKNAVCANMKHNKPRQNKKFPQLSRPKYWSLDTSPCQCNIVVCTISKKIVCTVHTTILHWQENPICTYNIFNF